MFVMFLADRIEMITEAPIFLPVGRNYWESWRRTGPGRGGWKTMEEMGELRDCVLLSDAPSSEAGAVGGGGTIQRGKQEKIVYAKRHALAW